MWLTQSRLLKWLLVIGLGLSLRAMTEGLTPALAQTGPEPFPGEVRAEGIWAGPGPDATLIGLGRRRLLAWDAAGQYQMWQYHPALADKPAAWPLQRLTDDVRPTAGLGLGSAYLGDDRFLDWRAATGEFQVWRYSPESPTGGPVPAPQVINAGTMTAIDPEANLIYAGDHRLLAWTPASGYYQLWRYDPALIGRLTSFPGELLAEGTWPTIGADHQLVYLGYRRFLDWQPASGHYRIWRYNPMAGGADNPLVGEPLAEGESPALRAEQQLISLGENYLLAWTPATGQYRLWQFDLLTIAAFSPAEIAARLDDRASGVTVITHGRQLADGDGDSMLTLAEDIHQIAGGWLLDFDVDGTGVAFFDTCTNDCQDPEPGQKGTNEVVLLFDWSAASNEASAGWGEAAGDALFSLLIETHLLNPTAATNLPYHLIGHSFGTAVSSELVERLAQLGIPVDHVTALDPHDFDQGFGFDNAQHLYDLGQPEGYGVTTWNNVTFADVYYQTRGAAGSVIPIPNGRPISGAYNRFLLAELPDPGAYAGFDNDHGYVWGCFYRATVRGVLPVDCPLPVANPTYSQTGYGFGRLAQLAARPAPNFYMDQSHTYSNPQLVDVATGQPNQAGLDALGLTAQQIIDGGWTPAWRPEVISNGDFEHYNTQRVDIIPLVCTNGAENTCPQPGWSYHGGGGEGHFDQTNGNTYLVLDWANTYHSHNWLYVPPTATGLEFDLRREDGPQSGTDLFEVQIGGQTVISYTLVEGDEDAGFIPQKVTLPPAWPGHVATITFQFATEIELLDGATVWIDDVKFTLAAGQIYLPLVRK